MRISLILYFLILLQTPQVFSQINHTISLTFDRVDADYSYEEMQELLESFGYQDRLQLEKDLSNSRQYLLLGDFISVIGFSSILRSLDVQKPIETQDVVGREILNLESVKGSIESKKNIIKWIYDSARVITAAPFESDKEIRRLTQRVAVEIENLKKVQTDILEADTISIEEAKLSAIDQLKQFLESVEHSLFLLKAMSLSESNQRFLSLREQLEAELEAGGVIHPRLNEMSPALRVNGGEEESTFAVIDARKQISRRVRAELLTEIIEESLRPDFKWLFYTETKENFLFPIWVNLFRRWGQVIVKEDKDLMFRVNKALLNSYLFRMTQEDQKYFLNINSAPTARFFFQELAENPLIDNWVKFFSSVKVGDLESIERLRPTVLRNVAEEESGKNYYFYRYRQPGIADKVDVSMTPDMEKNLNLKPLIEEGQSKAPYCSKVL